MVVIKRTLLYLLLIIVIRIFIFSNNEVLNGVNISIEIENLINNGKESNIIDLTQLKFNEWDQIIIWTPYSDIREFKLNKMYILFESKHINLSESKNILLFLKNNKIEGYAIFNRKLVDFTILNTQLNRIDRNHAVFKFDGRIDYSQAQFLNK